MASSATACPKPDGRSSGAHRACRDSLRKHKAMLNTGILPVPRGICGGTPGSPKARGLRRATGSPRVKDPGGPALRVAPNSKSPEAAVGEMRLPCEVEVLSRHLPVLGLKSRGKGVRAVVSLCQAPRGRACLLVSTMKDKRGTRYELKENIEQLFNKFVDEGKATVRLKEPPVDICLSKANPGNLKSLLSAVRMAHRGCDVNIPLSTLKPAKTSEFENLKTKMVIASLKDYPLSKSFPCSLEHLQVSHCRLARVDMRMLCLKNLRKLDLSHNCIKTLPATIGDLTHLQELNLSDNHLESFSVSLCQSTLQKSLQSLDLSKNKLRALPVQFCQFRELMNLTLSDNELIQLPFKIGQLKNLRFLAAARNKLTKLPCEFKMLSLEYLDLFGNTFEKPEVLPIVKLQVPLTLLEFSARAVLSHRISYGPHIIPFHLCQDFDTAKTCVCGRFCLDSFIQGTATINLHSVAHTVVLVDNVDRMEAPIITYFCSLTCYVNSSDMLK